MEYPTNSVPPNVKEEAWDTSYLTDSSQIKEEKLDTSFLRDTCIKQEEVDTKIIKNACIKQEEEDTTNIKNTYIKQEEVDTTGIKRTIKEEAELDLGFDRDTYIKQEELDTTNIQRIIKEEAELDLPFDRGLLKEGHHTSLNFEEKCIEVAKKEDAMFYNFLGISSPQKENSLNYSSIPHLVSHSTETPFRYLGHDNCFSQSSSLKKHTGIYTGENSFHCLENGKYFKQSNTLEEQMHVQTGAPRKTLVRPRSGISSSCHKTDIPSCIYSKVSHCEVVLCRGVPEHVTSTIRVPKRQRNKTGRNIFVSLTLLEVFDEVRSVFLETFQVFFPVTDYLVAFKEGSNGVLPRIQGYFKMVNKYPRIIVSQSLAEMWPGLHLDLYFVRNTRNLITFISKHDPHLITNLSISMLHKNYRDTLNISTIDTENQESHYLKRQRNMMEHGLLPSSSIVNFFKMHRNKTGRNIFVSLTLLEVFDDVRSVFLETFQVFFPVTDYLVAFKEGSNGVLPLIQGYFKMVNKYPIIIIIESLGEMWPGLHLSVGFVRNTRNMISYLSKSDLHLITNLSISKLHKNYKDKVNYTEDQESHYLKKQKRRGQHFFVTLILLEVFDEVRSVFLETFQVFFPVMDYIVTVKEGSNGDLPKIQGYFKTINSYPLINVSESLAEMWPDLHVDVQSVVYADNIINYISKYDPHLITNLSISKLHKNYKDVITNSGIPTEEEESHCSKSVTSLRQLPNLKMHSEERSFHSLNNKISFKQSSALKSHERNHSVEKPFHCLDCGKRYYRSHHFKAHLRIHTGEKPFHCLECGKSFRVFERLKAHSRIHTGEKPFQCLECGKSFREAGNFRAHLRTHTGEKPFHCLNCGKSFSQSLQLKRHERTHTGEKPFQCLQCKKRFTQYVSLKSHMKIHS